VESDAYVSLAAATFTAFSAGGGPDEVLRPVEMLVHDSDVVRDEAVEQARGLGLPDQRALVQTLSFGCRGFHRRIGPSRRLGRSRRRPHAWTSLGPVDVVPLAESGAGEIRALVEQISRDQTLDGLVRWPRSRLSTTAQAADGNVGRVRGLRVGVLADAHDAFWDLSDCPAGERPGAGALVSIKAFW
jgi:hypothetical protein